jgi:hypothetical protein
MLHFPLHSYKMALQRLKPLHFVHGKELPRTVIKNNNTYKVILLQTNNNLKKLKLKFGNHVL